MDVCSQVIYKNLSESFLFSIYFRNHQLSKFPMRQWELHWPCQQLHLWVSTWLYRCQLWYRCVHILLIIILCLHMRCPRKNEFSSFVFILIIIYRFCFTNLYLKISININRGIELPVPLGSCFVPNKIHVTLNNVLFIQKSVGVSAPHVYTARVKITQQHTTVPVILCMAE